MKYITIDGIFVFNDYKETYVRRCVLKIVKEKEVMNNEVILVTAYFDIGRKEYSVYPRDREKYFSYFNEWAGIKNKLIVYCGNEKDCYEIEKIRKNKGIPSDRTEIIIIDDICKIEPEIYNKMENISKDNSFLKFRFYDVACSNIAKYDYLMLMKYYFLYAAYNDEKLNGYDNIVWIDFGFNHGNAYYLNNKDFDFLWKWEFLNDIELFCLSDPKDMSLIDSLQFQKDCIQGTVVGCKKKALRG